MRNLFPNAWHVARREYLQRVRSRTFVIVTVVLAIVGLGIAMLPVIGRLIAGDETTTVAVHAADAELRQSTVTALGLVLSAASEGEGVTWEIVSVEDADAGRRQVEDDEVNGLLSVSRDGDGELAFDLLTDAGPTSQWLFAVRQAATQVSIGDRLERSGIDPSLAAQIFSPTPFDISPIDPNAPEPDFGAGYILSNVLVILTFMAVVTYGSWVATGVAEEKSSRVMELLITAATPRQLMAGKVLGNGLAGLTQYGVVLVAALGGWLLQDELARRILGGGASGELEALDLGVLVPFGLFFVPGFLLYCILYAGLGSLASRQEDVTQVTGPMLFVGMGGYFASFVAMSTPDQPWVQVVSLIPFFSPYLLPIRHLLGGGVAPWEWLVAGALMVVFLAGALWIAARIYSAGVLLYGQRLGLRSAWRAIRVNR
jgi:ABC-2 type transport system permease protein